MPAPQSLIGPKVILFGDSGTGKTTALLTLIDAGITPFVVATEQNFIQVAKPVLGTKAHYKFIAPRPVKGLAKIEGILKNINMLTYENLCKTTDPFKMEHRKMLDLVGVMNKFVCDCCGKDWGSVETWNTDRAIVIDSLSGLTDMAWGLVIGNKPVKAMPDYAIAQNAIRMMLDPLTSEVKSTFVLTAHIDREKDEITGGSYVTLKTVGQKLGPDLPRLFSDVIRTRKQGQNFYWDTEDPTATVVPRHVKISSVLPPSFVPLITEWKARGGQIAPTQS